MSSGLKVFATMEEALAAGFVPYDRTPDGYIVRRDEGNAFSLAIVRAERTAPAPESPQPETSAADRV